MPGRNQDQARIVFAPAFALLGDIHDAKRAAGENDAGIGCAVMQGERIKRITVFGHGSRNEAPVEGIGDAERQRPRTANAPTPGS